jgi:hypothetical protein
MARRTRNRMELRNQFEAAEAREKEQSEDEEEEEGEEGGEVAEAEAGEEEEAPAPVKKAKKKVVAKEAKPKRSRTAKVVRQKVVWVVFDNSNKRIQAFPYTQKQDAVDLATKLQTDKKSTYFVQPIKEPIEE